jgi:hypothetical protein
MKMAISRPKTEIEVSPRVIRIICSTPTEILPKRMAAPIKRSAKATRLYRTFWRTDSLKVCMAITVTRMFAPAKVEESRS